MLSRYVARRTKSIIPNSIAYNEAYHENLTHNNELLAEFYSRTDVATAVDPRTEVRER